LDYGAATADPVQGRSKEIHLGRVQYWVGGTNEWPKPRVGWGQFLKFVFEIFALKMVHFGAKVTNAVHHHWFSAVTVK